VKVEELTESAASEALSLIRMPPSLSQRNGTALIQQLLETVVSANRIGKA